jgi:tRNA threonylcarbamoyladenosine biosynthesis protein TsaB
MILALDSSAARGSVALVEGGETVREIFVDTPRGRGGALFAALENILRADPVLERVVTGTGPGSYNGVRAALAGGWGIAQARGIPFVGVCSLLGLAEGEYCAVGDARRGQYYYARISGGTMVAEPVLLTPEAVLERIGNRRVLVPAPVDFLPDAELAQPSAARLARLAPEHAAGLPEPLYLKAPYITEQRKAPPRG